MSRKIILMRHGQPKLDATDKMSALDMKDWIEQYDHPKLPTNPYRMPASNSPQSPR